MLRAVIINITLFLASRGSREAELEGDGEQQLWTYTCLGVLASLMATSVHNLQAVNFALAASVYSSVQWECTLTPRPEQGGGEEEVRCTLCQCALVRSVEGGS